MANSHKKSDSHIKDPDYGTGKKKLSSYIIGVVLSLILVLIPYEAVKLHSMGNEALYVTLIVCALIQLVVQAVCFLRLNTDTNQGEMNILSFLSAIVVVIIVVVASIWIMWHLNYNMTH